MSRTKKILGCIVAVLVVLCMLLGAAIATFKITGLKFCTVDGHSMDSTLYDGERLVLNPSADPRFGDILVFEYNGAYLIKRIIGLPGDTIVVSDGVLYINNVKYDEPYLSDENVVKFRESSFAATVGEDEYFVMGDNRDNSHDSRGFGCISKDCITGIAIWRL